eukprot:JP441525.1.p2 GENE.JP441525.1~~JP441525.1.p2  ORF type:complete len:90 (-),score=23.23 JP441525.1:37-306(-)
MGVHTSPSLTHTLTLMFQQLPATFNQPTWVSLKNSGLALLDASPKVKSQRALQAYSKDLTKVADFLNEGRVHHAAAWMLVSAGQMRGVF